MKFAFFAFLSLSNFLYAAESNMSFKGIYESTYVRLDYVDTECAYKIDYNGDTGILTVKGVDHPVTRTACRRPVYEDVFSCQGVKCTSLTDSSKLLDAYILPQDNILYRAEINPTIKVNFRKLNVPLSKPLFFNGDSYRSGVIDIPAKLRYDGGGIIDFVNSQIRSDLVKIQEEAETDAIRRCESIYPSCKLKSSSYQGLDLKTINAYAGGVAQARVSPFWKAVATPVGK